MQPIGNVMSRPSRVFFRDGRSFFQAAAAAMRFALDWRKSRRRELMASLEKYQLLAQEFRSRAEMPNLSGQRKELLAFATHFERRVVEIREANPLLLH